MKVYIVIKKRTANLLWAKSRRAAMFNPKHHELQPDEVITELDTEVIDRINELLGDDHTIDEAIERLIYTGRDAANPEGGE